MTPGGESRRRAVASTGLGAVLEEEKNNVNIMLNTKDSVDFIKQLANKMVLFALYIVLTMVKTYFFVK